MVVKCLCLQLSDRVVMIHEAKRIAIRFYLCSTISDSFPEDFYFESANASVFFFLPIMFINFSSRANLFSKEVNREFVSAKLHLFFPRTL